jgi:hypothetical protein
MLLIATMMLAISLPARAADSSSYSAYDPEGACREIKASLNALANAEHRQGLALDLASEGASTAIVAARLSDLLDRSQDLRTVLRRARQSPFARDSMVDQCTRMGFRALVISEKLTSDVEAMLYDDDEENPALAELPQIKSNAPAQAPARIR